MTSQKPSTSTNDIISSIKQEGPSNCHISQIPGLSPTVKAVNDDKAQGRRSGVLATDSDFIRLSKQGGHKGLLWHSETLSASTSHSYKAPAWFSDNGNPSLITSEPKKSPRAFQRREPPFGSDNMSAWERDDGSACTEICTRQPQNSSIPEIETEEANKLPTVSQKGERSKFRRIVFDKKPAPVDMSTLLSFGYVEESKPSP